MFTFDAYALRSGPTTRHCRHASRARWESVDYENVIRSHEGLLTAGLMLACVVAFAEGTRFSDVAPLASSAGPTADESTPITFGNEFRQRSIADRDTQLIALNPNAGEWDMITIE